MLIGINTYASINNKNMAQALFSAITKNCDLCLAYNSQTDTQILSDHFKCIT